MEHVVFSTTNYHARILMRCLYKTTFSVTEVKYLLDDGLIRIIICTLKLYSNVIY